MNIIIGNNAAPLSTGNANIIMGQDAGARLTTAVSTVAIGHNALNIIRQGGIILLLDIELYMESSYNVAIGTTALMVIAVFPRTRERKIQQLVLRH